MQNRRINLIRGRKSIGVLALALLAVCLNTGLARAGAFEGRFTLPVETRWGGATLAPGVYSFVLDNQILRGLVLVSGTKRTAMVRPGMIDHQHIPGGSVLICERSGGRLVVRSLYIQQLGLLLGYLAPRGERRMMAQAPQLLQRVPIASGK